MTKWIEGGICAARSYAGWGIPCGIKASRLPDLAMVMSETPAKAVGVFTKNQTAAASVMENRKRIGTGNVQAFLVNSGIANACTGSRGLKDNRRMAALASHCAGIAAGKTLVCSTGIIGEFLPMKKIEKGIPLLVAGLRPSGGKRFAKAILTTDTRIKEAAIELTMGGRRVRIGGACKGSGMIDPNMATMLAFFTTDALIGKAELRRYFRLAVNRSFNCVTVDGDSSTNDSVLMMANGAAGNRRLNGSELARFGKALETLMVRLAKEVARDGEGATKLVEVSVIGARTHGDARVAAKSVANSLLVKTALFGNDPNWGRILCAAGYSGARFRPEALGLRICGIPVMHKGLPVRFSESGLRRKMKKTVDIQVSLGSGRGHARVWTCDLSYDYVRINAEYHT